MIASAPTVADLPLDKLTGIAVFLIIMHGLTLFFAWKVIRESRKQ